MTPSIARQSVIIKCSLRKSVLLGNYEFYYIGGLISGLFHLEASADMSPQELKDYLDGEIPKLPARDEREAFLLGMVKNYEPLPEHDEQMRELFRWGVNEKEPWQLQVSPDEQR